MKLHLLSSKLACRRDTDLFLSTLFVSKCRFQDFQKNRHFLCRKKIDTFCVDFRNEENIKICLIEFIKSTRKSNLNYRFPLRKSYFRVQNHQNFRLRPPMTLHQFPQNFACGAGWKHYLFVRYFDRVLKCELFLSTLFLSKKSVDFEFGNRHFFVDSEIT